MLTTPDPRRWRALALLCGAFFMLAGIGTALALLLLGRPRKAPQERLAAAEKVLDDLYGVPVSIQSD